MILQMNHSSRFHQDCPYNSVASRLLPVSWKGSQQPNETLHAHWDQHRSTTSAIWALQTQRTHCSRGHPCTVHTWQMPKHSSSWTAAQRLRPRQMSYPHVLHANTTSAHTDVKAHGVKGSSLWAASSQAPPSYAWQKPTLTHASALTPPATTNIFNRTKVCTHIALCRASTICRVACACISQFRKAVLPGRGRARQSRMGLGKPDSNVMHSPATPPQDAHGTLASTSGLPPQSTAAVYLLHLLTS